MSTPNHPPPGDVAAGSKLTAMSRKESWALVKQAALGRLAFVMDGWPLVMPVNYLVIDALERYQRFYGDDLEFEYPTGSGKRLTLDLIIADLQDRLISLFTRDADGRRACFGGTERMQTDPAWKDNILFHEYFHGDDGSGLGASHQTGWTGIVADLIIRSRRGEYRRLTDVLTREQQLPRAA